MLPHAQHTVIDGVLETERMENQVERLPERHVLELAIEGAFGIRVEHDTDVGLAHQQLQQFANGDRLGKAQRQCLLERLGSAPFLELAHRNGRQPWRLRPQASLGRRHLVLMRRRQRHLSHGRLRCRLTASGRRLRTNHRTHRRLLPLRGCSRRRRRPGRENERDRERRVDHRCACAGFHMHSPKAEAYETLRPPGLYLGKLCWRH